jgi:hypothetical protein
MANKRAKMLPCIFLIDFSHYCLKSDLLPLQESIYSFRIVLSVKLLDFRDEEVS